jgi:hypothetical protein
LIPILFKDFLELAFGEGVNVVEELGEWIGEGAIVG